MTDRANSSWRRTWELFHAALDTDPSERTLRLREACEDDQALLEEVLELLRAHEQPVDLLDSPTGLRAAADLDDGPEDDSGEDSRATPRPGEILAGRFEIVRLLGEGGMGTVHEALDLSLGKRVAVKVLRSELARDAATRQRFRREVQLAQKVTHPNASRIHDLFEESGADGERIAFLVMELLEGETLAERIGRCSRLSEAEALEIFEQVAAAVSAAHEQGVIHRDLKAANVFLTETDEGSSRAVVMDFGIAMSLVESEEALRLTRVGQLVGSPSTMAPEQLTSGEITPRTDVHALGQLLFEMLTGRLPFVGRSVLEAAVGRLHRPAPPLRSFAPEVSRHLERVVAQSLALRPEDRPASPEALVELLRRPEASTPRARAPWIAAGAVAAALAVVALVSSSRDETSTPPPVVAASGPRPIVAVLPFEDETPADGADAERDPTLADGLSGGLVSELSGMPGLGVISWSSTSRLRGSPLDAVEIGSELGAGHLVTGRVRREGERFDLEVELIDAQSGRLAWSGSTGGSVGDLFALQRELAGRLAAAMPLADASTALERTPATSLAPAAAQDEYLKALYLWNWAWQHLHESPAAEWSETIERNGARAVEHLDAALALAPDFAPAVALQARWKLHLGEVDAAAESALRAAELDPRLPEALVARAVCVHVEQRDWAAARADLERALERRPGDASARRWLAWLLQLLGLHEEAVEIIERAVQLSPQDAGLQFELGTALYRARHFDAAADRLGVVAELFPTSYAVHSYLAKALVHAGRNEEAFVALQQCCKTRGCYATASIILAHGGSWTLGEHLLESSGRRLRGIPRYMAELSALAGENELAIRHLERDELDRPDPLGHALGWVWPPLLMQEPPFDSLQGHPELEALACRLALPSCGANPGGGG